MAAQAVAGPGLEAEAGQQAALLGSDCLLPVPGALVVVAAVEVAGVAAVVAAVAAAAAAVAEGVAVSPVVAVPSADQPKPKRTRWERSC